MKCKVDEVGEMPFFKCYALSRAHIQLNSTADKTDKPKAVSAENSEEGKQALSDILKYS